MGSALRLAPDAAQASTLASYIATLEGEDLVAHGLADTSPFRRAIDKDPHEKQNVVEQNAATTTEMRQHAEAQRQLAASQAVEGGAQAKLTKEECEKLRVLGYVQDCDSVN